MFATSFPRTISLLRTSIGPPVTACDFNELCTNMLRKVRDFRIALQRFTSDLQSFKSCECAEREWDDLKMTRMCNVRQVFQVAETALLASDRSRLYQWHEAFTFACQTLSKATQVAQRIEIHLFVAKKWRHIFVNPLKCSEVCFTKSMSLNICSVAPAKMSWASPTYFAVLAASQPHASAPPSLSPWCHNSFEKEINDLRKEKSKILEQMFNYSWRKNDLTLFEISRFLRLLKAAGRKVQMHQDVIGPQTGDQHPRSHSSIWPSPEPNQDKYGKMQRSKTSK